MGTEDDSSPDRPAMCFPLNMPSPSAPIPKLLWQGAQRFRPDPGDTAVSVEVADSWLVVDGPSRGLDRHRERFTGSCPDPGRASVTRRLVLAAAERRGQPVRSERVRPEELIGLECWSMSALHGIRATDPSGLVSSTRATNSEPTMDRWRKLWSGPGSPSAAGTATRAEVPDPQGERSTSPSAKIVTLRWQSRPFSSVPRFSWMIVP